jgi:hypothetical protein
MKQYQYFITAIFKFLVENQWTEQMNYELKLILRVILWRKVSVIENLTFLGIRISDRDDYVGKIWEWCEIKNEPLGTMVDINFMVWMRFLKRKLGVNIGERT